LGKKSDIQKVINKLVLKTLPQPNHGSARGHDKFYIHNGAQQHNCEMT